MPDKKTQIEELNQNITELHDTVKEHNKDGARETIDYVKLAEELHKLQTAKDEEAAPERPVRKGEEIYHNDVQPKLPRRLRKLSPEELVMSKMLLTAAKKPVSKELEEAVLKAMDTDTAGAGLEYTDEVLSPITWDDVFPATDIAQTIPEYDMPSDPTKFPLSLGDATFRKGIQNTPPTPEDPVTDDSTLTTTEQVAEVDWSYSLDEDSVVAQMPEVRRTLIRNASETIDAFILNADDTSAATGNINSDDGTPDADSYYLSEGQDGIRHLWLVDSTGQGTDAGGDALVDADLIGLIADLGKYFKDAMNDVVIVPDYSAYLAGMLGLDTVRTLDKWGPQYTAKSGQLATYQGAAVVPSVFHPLGMADGKVSVTPANNTLGSISAYNALMWRLGFRRQPLIEVDKDIQKRSYIMVASMRVAIGARERSSATHTSGVYNILVA